MDFKRHGRWGDGPGGAGNRSATLSATSLVSTTFSSIPTKLEYQHVLVDVRGTQQDALVDILDFLKPAARLANVEKQYSFPFLFASSDRLILWI